MAASLDESKTRSRSVIFKQIPDIWCKVYVCLMLLAQSGAYYRTLTENMMDVKLTSRTAIESGRNSNGVVAGAASDTFARWLYGMPHRMGNIVLRWDTLFMIVCLIRPRQPPLTVVMTLMTGRIQWNTKRFATARWTTGTNQKKCDVISWVNDGIAEFIL